MRWIRYDTLVPAIDEQIKFFENRLPNQYLVSQNERFIQRLSAHDVHRDAIRHPNGILPSVRILSHFAAIDFDAERVQDVRGNNHAHRSCVDHRVGFVTAHLLRPDFTGACSDLVHVVGELDPDSELSHGRDYIISPLRRRIVRSVSPATS